MSKLRGFVLLLALCWTLGTLGCGCSDTKPPGVTVPPKLPPTGPGPNDVKYMTDTKSTEKDKSKDKDEPTKKTPPTPPGK